MTNETGQHSEDGSLTLGALLYTGNPHPIPESDWVRLVQSIAAGNLRALRALYSRTYRLVNSLVLRITNNPEIAKEVLLDVYYDIWRRAPAYDPENETAIAWITYQARSQAINGRRAQQLSRPAATIESLRHESSSNDLWARLGRRIALETGSAPPVTDMSEWREPEWSEVAPGISCKLLATDVSRQRVSMLVRLTPGTAYPAHTHAGVEQLHLLEGELWIDEKKLYPGDYNRAEPGTADNRVWTETGCACVLITSTNDVIA